jgi:hypothetical protein
MNETTLDSLGERHLQLFGTIIQWFAQYESLMQDVMATVTGSDFAAIMLLTRGLDFNEKRLALLDLLRHRPVPLDHFDRVCSYLTIPQNFAPLRNDIAHSTWRSSEPANSIQPNWILRLPAGIVPLRNDPNAPEEAFIERGQDDVAYTLDDLEKIAVALAGNHRQFFEYLLQVGLVRSTA